MNKSEFIDLLAKEHKCTKAEAEQTVKIFTNAVISALTKGEEITLIGFGKFYNSKVEAREGRNPQTGKPVTIEAYIQPKFKAGSSLKDACNNKGKKATDLKGNKGKK